MGDRPLFTDDGRLRLLDAVGRLTKEGVRAEASILTTFSVNFAFYEDVILRLFERAGCRLNVLMVDARQVAAAIADPLRRPRRAGRDYILAPIEAPNAFHPKVLALLAEKRPMLAIGSHNATEAGFARNLEATVCWGHDGAGVPREFMIDAVAFATDWLASSPGFEPGVAAEVTDRLRRLCPGIGSGPSDPEAKFLGWRRGDRSLLEQFGDTVRGDVRRVLAVGPFFDGGLRLMREVERIWAPGEIVAAVQPDTVSLLELGAAQPQLKFVDAASLLAPGDGDSPDAKRKWPYLHAKALAVETSEGRWLAIGSANPSAPAWMQAEAGNAEAVVVLSGRAAAEAFGRLGLDRLAGARLLSAEELAAASTRTKEEILTSKTVDPITNPVRMAFVDGARIHLPGIESGACRRAIELGDDERPIASAIFFSALDGSEMSLGDDGAGASLVRVDGDAGPLSTLVIHSLAKIRAAARPQSAGRVLERLGSLDVLDDGVDELLNLIDKYIFTETVEGGGSRPPNPAKPAADPTDDVPFGPRGISLLVLRKPGQKGRSIIEFELSEIISILIRDLTEIRVDDGDRRDVDVEDEGADPPAPVPDEEVRSGHVDWERLVAACRGRVGTMINKLRKRLDGPVPDVDKATWLFGRMLTILSLIRKLRGRPPPLGLNVRQRGRPQSLVSADQIRSLFKACMEALYRRNNGIASWIERSADHRVAHERATLDALLLWAAREIRADVEAQAVFGESDENRTRRLGDKADAAVAAMSAAAHPDVTSLLLGRLGTDLVWHDTAPSAPDWAERHVQFGSRLQTAAASNGWLPTLKNSAKPGDMVVWMTEPGFPRVVVSASADKAILIGIGDEHGRHMTKLKQVAVAPVDLDALLARANSNLRD